MTRVATIDFEQNSGKWRDNRIGKLGRCCSYHFCPQAMQHSRNPGLAPQPYICTRYSIFGLCPVHYYYTTQVGSQAFSKQLLRKSTLSSLIPPFSRPRRGPTANQGALRFPSFAPFFCRRLYLWPPAKEATKWTGGRSRGERLEFFIYPSSLRCMQLE